MLRIRLLALIGLTALAACTAKPAGEPGSGQSRMAGKDYAGHVAALRERLPDQQFSIVVQPPFVVVGDESRAVVKRRAEQTVQWAVDMLKKDYFENDPDHIIDVWLFKDRRSYERNAVELFGETPTTRFGYYSPNNRALVMNISTGGGTLVHEIVHPFMAANFPACPAWFNEGLGSLYEQCGEQDGKIVGYTNWRLPALQAVIAAGHLPPVQTLVETTTEKFYGVDEGTNYAYARYLCLYLQEKGVLREFYHAFVVAHRDDPTGWNTLVKVLGRNDMDAFQVEFEAWVSELRYG